MKFKKFIPALAVLSALIPCIFSPSCANTTQAPSGGPKDTIPPVLTRVTPLSGTVGVPVHDTKIMFTFDEYVKVKDPKAIFLSPPQIKSPKFKIKGKSVIVYFEEDLRPNTTYALDISGAVVDNNEGNQFPGFTTVFSTGDTIDSMFVCGTVRDCNDLKPMKGATVLLYKDHRDSAVFLERPFAAAKTDDWGYFSIRNIQDTSYRIYALVDANNNNMYDPDEDRIAFLDSLFVPKRVVNDSVPELVKYDPKDTLLCLARENDMTLNVFRERPSKQLLMNSKRLSKRFSYITFMAPDTRIDSLWFQGFPSSKVITEFNPRKDSLLLWLNSQKKMPDTLKLWVKYWKTDSLGVLSPVSEKVDLVQENVSKDKKKKLAHGDTICKLKIVAAPETVEQVGMAIEFDEPPFLGKFEDLIFKSVNPRQQEADEKFSIERDSTNLRRYVITPKNKIMPGFDYKFKIPERTFMDINGFWNDSTEVTLTLPTDETLSSLTLNVTGVSGRCIVDLLGSDRKTLVRSYTITKDAVLAFPYLKEGSYLVRITEDRNRNGIVDSGNLLAHRQPEKVVFYKKDNKEEIKIAEKFEVFQDVDLNELFEQ